MIWGAHPYFWKHQHMDSPPKKKNIFQPPSIFRGFASLLVSRRVTVPYPTVSFTSPRLCRRFSNHGDFRHFREVYCLHLCTAHLWHFHLASWHGDFWCLVGCQRLGVARKGAISPGFLVSTFLGETNEHM